MIKPHSTKFLKTARYYSLGELSNNSKILWIVFHGYGQLAEKFIENFRDLVDDKTVVIAPEASNKFYLRGFDGKVGTNWMTKEDRLNEISDYTNMLESILLDFTGSIDLSKLQINIVAFSQGTHTAIRWISEFKKNISTLILWGGALPKEINYSADYEFWLKIKIKLVAGTKDRFITRNILDEEIKRLDELELNFEVIRFDGHHEINKTLVSEIHAKL